MSQLSKEQKLKEIIAEANKYGMNFISYKGVVNSEQAYKFVDIETGVDLSDLWTVDSAHSYMKKMSFKVIAL